MCGIVGFIQSSSGDLPGSLEPMMAMLYHRGPDDGGAWIDGEARVALGHRRLSILDLSPEGRQPMVSASGRFVLTFNGEIYNFAELKQLLGDRHSFRGGSDTEVMLAAFEEWGIAGAVEKFVGMFAFGVWDRQERALTLVRDRMGEKPLYYGWNEGAFLFASELGAMEAHTGFRGTIDRRSVGFLMRHGYIPAPGSIFEGIYKLVPGGLLTVPHTDLRAKPPSFSPSPEDTSARLRPVRYWSLRGVAIAGIERRERFDERAAGDELERRLEEAVRLQMVADVPLGAFLSGGIDSSLVVALMQRFSRRPVRTFSIGFHEHGYNEAPHAAAVARYLGTQHTELYVSAQAACDVIPRLASIYSEPFADSSQVPTYLVARLAREQVTVSLSGDGGDELFAGYGRYGVAEGLWRNLGRIPPSGRRLAGRCIGAVPARWWDVVSALGQLVLPQRFHLRSAGSKASRLARMLDAPTKQALYLEMLSYVQQPTDFVLGLRAELGDPSRELIGDAVSNFYEYMMLWDGLTYLPDDILVKVDRAGMAVSLESRMPLLDHRVVEHAWTFPLETKVQGGETKYPLRRILFKHVPRKILDRPKMGFGIPIDEWLRGPLRPWAEDLVSEAALVRTGLLDPTVVRGLWAGHISGRNPNGYLLWNILALQSWSSQRAATDRVPSAGTAVEIVPGRVRAAAPFAS
jgi:asparagine synthase (glutamine-hydrolysing)